MQKSEKEQPLQPAQSQKKQPGIEKKMKPRPEFKGRENGPAGRLDGKAAIITGGDSGIGRAVAVAFAREGADVCIAYLNEHADAEENRNEVEKLGNRLPCYVFLASEVESKHGAVGAILKTTSPQKTLYI